MIRKISRAGVALAVFSSLVAVAAVGAPASADGSGATVLRGTFQSDEVFNVNGTPTLFTFICDEQRVQLPDGSATDTAQCTLNAGQTAPTAAAHEHPGAVYLSDFFGNGAPGFAGVFLTFDWHGVVTPDGHVTMVATFAAS